MTLLVAGAPAAAQTVYWTDSVRVQSAKLDGSGMRVLAARLLHDPLGVCPSNQHSIASTFSG